MSAFLIEDSVSRLFAQEVDKGLIERAEQGEFPAVLWQLVQEQGFTALLADEASGGIAADWESAFPLLTALGQYQVPLPVAESVVARLLLAAGGQAAPDEGPIALIGEGAARDLRISDDGQHLSGEARSVDWAPWATHALVGLPHAPQQLAWVALRGPCVSLTAAQHRPSRMPLAHLRFEHAPCTLFANPWPAMPWPVWTLGAAATACMMVGALEFALDESVQYARDRVQFGKPIGQFQAVQQQLALMAGEFTSARMAAQVACRDLPSLHQQDVRSSAFSTAVAKIRAGEAANRATSIAHQVHGALGFTYEHALNFATRRLWTWRGDYGGAHAWAQHLGQAFVAGGAAQAWPALTQRMSPVDLAFT